MTDDGRAKISAEMRAALEKSLGYDDFFGWSTNRNFEELNVLESLAESMNAEGATFFGSLRVRGRKNDPPDCEALDARGLRAAIEVTDLVDGVAIRKFKGGRGAITGQSGPRVTFSRPWTASSLPKTQSTRVLKSPPTTADTFW